MPNVVRYRWFSLYFHLLERAHKSRFWLFFTQSICLGFFLFAFTLVPVFLRFFLFTRRNSSFILFAFFIEIILLDVYSLLFLRTRTSLKFFPIIVLILLFAFLIYINCNGYSFDFLSFYCMISLLTLCKGLFLVWVEIPAANNWSPQSFDTPKPRVPRMLFNPIFNNNWINDSPQLWTMFMPLFGKDFFDRRHLAFLNNEIQQLSYYAEISNGENNLFSFEERHLMDLPGFMNDDVRFRV